MTTTITSPATLLTQMSAAQGVAGISAYAVAVKNGYTGTEAGWLLTLVGPAWPSTGVQAASEAARDAAVVAKDLAVAAKDTAVLSATNTNDDAVAVALAKSSVDSSTTTVTELAAQVNIDVGVIAGYKDTVALDKAAVALDKSAVAADKLTVSGYKDAVATDKTDTLGYKNSASDSAVAAALSASNADTSEAMAQAWAITPTDVAVSGSDYSALHWAAKSAESQGLAGSFATSANDAKVAAQAAVVAAGNASRLTAGTVTVGAAAVTITGEPGSQVLNLVIPPGATGATGATGPAGSAGADGPTGPTGPAGDPADIPASTHAATAKTTPADADEIPLVDSAASWVLKKLTWVNIKSTLATYFSSLYLGLTGGTIAGGTRTVAGSTLTITETLNNAGVTFPGALVIDQTHTASASGSLIADFRVGGVTKHSIEKSGAHKFTSSVAHSGTGTNPAKIIFIPGFGVDTGFRVATYHQLGVAGSDITAAFYYSNETAQTLHVAGPGAIGFGADSAGGTELDTMLRRDAPGTLAQRNGTAAQTFRLYNTYTDASNYERGFMRWASNVLEIGTEAGGTGTLRNVKLVLGNNSIDTLTATHIAFKVSGVTNHFAIDANNGVKVLPVRGYGWSSTTDATAAADTMLSRPSAKIIQPNDAAGGGAGIEMIEMTAPATPATNKVRIYAEDNGSGKTRLMVLFATGSAVQIAIEP